MKTASAQDLLKDYKAKRNFARTQEPSGDEPAGEQAERGSFVVQKHDATRLHYDFRLELDGVLKSWAVTKGPSNNPADKRLAVRVEDHPLEYGGFEGTIPEGEYGGGTVMLWDRGSWEPLGDAHEGIEKGDLKIRLFGERMKGEWVLVHMKERDSKRKSGPDQENWLLIKHRDSYARDTDTLTTRFTRSVATGRNFKGIASGAAATKDSNVEPDAVWHSDTDAAEQADQNTRSIATRATKSSKGARLPAFRPVQLATLVDTVPEGNDWLFEMKYDGYRCLAAVAGDEVRLYTRSGLDWTDTFGSLVEPLQKLQIGSALIDGEICAFDSKGHTDFSTLKNMLSNGGRLEFFAFDLLEADGKDLTAQPLLERKEKLEKLLTRSSRGDPVQHSTHVRGQGQKVLDAITREGHEGVIAKRANSTYRGERTRDWLKIKCIKRQEFVIGGFSPSRKRRGFASLLLGTWEKGKLLYRGRVGTGFSDALLGELDDRLAALARKDSPFEAVPGEARGAKWVEPKLVAEIAFAEMTEDKVLRHPSFLGLREDQPGEEVRMERVVPDGAAIAEQLDIRLTSPGRVVDPTSGVTKGDLVAYYAAVVERMLPYIADRPLSLVRCPQGSSKTCFFQKHDTGGFPKELKSTPVPEKDGAAKDYFYLDSLEGLIAGTQMNVLEWHIWGSKRGDVERPDRLVFDIDPDVGLDFSHAIDAAKTIRDRLARQKLKSFAMVSGGKGVHVVMPLTPSVNWEVAKDFCRSFAQALADDEPERFTANLAKAKRKGRMFIDYLRNERGSTAIAPFSVRSRPGAPVAMPVSWDELDSLTAANAFTIAEGMKRVKAADPWQGYFAVKQKLKG